MHSIRTAHGSDRSTSSRESKSSSSRHSSSASDASSQSTALTSVLTASPQLLDKPGPVYAAGAACAEYTRPAVCVYETPELPPPAYPYPYAYARETPRFQPSYETYDEDLSPATNCCPRASTDTYVSEEEPEEDEEQAEAYGYGTTTATTATAAAAAAAAAAHAQASACASGSTTLIPPLPAYHHDVVDSSVRPATPRDFSQLFPSLHRLAIRHDEFTSDGNMNLRVDVTVPVGRRRRPTSYQLFHLRMYDLAKREFSLRRYCRDSGREVCNAKVRDADKKADNDAARGVLDEGSLQRSMTSALRSLGGIVAGRPGSLRRAHTASSLKTMASWRPGTAGSTTSAASRPGLVSDAASRPGLASAASFSLGLSAARDGSSSSSSSNNKSSSSNSRHRRSRPHPPNTNHIKLEFSNYARVDITRKTGSTSGVGVGGSTVRYVFEWWGHRYTWVRVAQKHLDGAALHLLRDDLAGPDAAVAHIVPETRAPTQVAADEVAGGWVPPCHMWISDESVLEAMTDVADIIVATGLIALVDDCIRTRWEEAPRRRPGTSSAELASARSFVQQVFHRRSGSGHAHLPSPLRRAAISTY